MSEGDEGFEGGALGFIYLGLSRLEREENKRMGLGLVSRALGRGFYT